MSDKQKLLAIFYSLGCVVDVTEYKDGRCVINVSGRKFLANKAGEIIKVMEA
jgi:hypothetical protein